MTAPSCRSRRAAAVVFAAALAAFTWKLIEPKPIPDAVLTEMSAWSASLPFLASKSAHLGGYAFLTVVGGLISPGRSWRVAVVLVLLLHAVGTEFGQTFVPNRTGKASDVIIDAVGVAIGVVGMRRVAGASDPVNQAPSPGG